MKAAIYRTFAGPLAIEKLADPVPPADGIVLQVCATGVCRSDWHGWMGYDPDIALPHVPGHEMAGVVVETGDQVQKFRAGDRVTLPFVCACGDCKQCLAGQQQVCDRQSQPGFTHWGSYAQFVAIHHADNNLVALPPQLSFSAAASLGCRFATAYRAVCSQGQVQAGQTVLVVGCGGVGLSAIVIATAMNAKVIAVDINQEALALAIELGAIATINAQGAEMVAAVMELTAGGADLSIDALGSSQTCLDAISSLRKQGRHVQVGLMTGEHRLAPLPMDLVVANELQILGSHGLQAHRYPQLLQLIKNEQLPLQKLVGRTVTLEQAAADLGNGGTFSGPGITVIDRF